MSEQKKEQPQQLQTEPELVKEQKISYTYWVDEKNKSRQLPQQHKPKKIQNPLPLQHKTSSSGPSKWNTSGTWEQRAISMKELNQSTTEVIKKLLEAKGSDLVLTSIQFEGDFKQIFSNNKKKVLYEIKGAINFEGEELSIKVEELTDTGDQEYSIKGKNKDQKKKLQTVSEIIINSVMQNFNRYKEL